MTNEQQKHTGLPWYFPLKFTNHGGSAGIVPDPNQENNPHTNIGNITCFGDRGISLEEANANGEFIIKACNSFYEKEAEIERLRYLLLFAETEMRYAGWGKLEDDNIGRNAVYEAIKGMLAL